MDVSRQRAIRRERWHVRTHVRVHACEWHYAEVAEALDTSVSMVGIGRSSVVYRFA